MVKVRLLELSSIWLQSATGEEQILQVNSMIGS